MSDSWEHIRADAVVLEWAEIMRVQGGLSRTGTLAGHDELVSLVEAALEESYRRGAKIGEFNNG